MRTLARMIAVAGIGFLPALALAGVVKPGLWEVDVDDLPQTDQQQIPPAQAEQLKKAGIDPSKLMAAMHRPQYCLTAEQAKFDQPPPAGGNNNCKVQEWKNAGKTLTGKMDCDGEFKGTIGMKAVLKSNTEYHSDVVMNGTFRGQPHMTVVRSTSYWLAADCGSVKPYAIKQ